jgi:hypothetical protein
LRPPFSCFFTDPNDGQMLVSVTARDLKTGAFDMQNITAAGNFVAPC